MHCFAGHRPRGLLHSQRDSRVQNGPGGTLANFAASAQTEDREQDTSQADFLVAGQTAAVQTNTATGLAALQNNTTGIDNTATGFDALFNNTTGSFNTATGA